MPPKKKSEYAVPKLKDFSAKALDKAGTELLAALEEELQGVKNEAKWKVFRDRWMARTNGILTQINDLWLKAAPKEAKPRVGVRFNDLSQQVKVKVGEAEERYKNIAILIDPVAKAVERATRTLTVAESLDITLPGNRRPLGAEHPIIKTMNEIVGVFRDLGYSVEEGPEIETDYYNFEALNFPPNHPARDTQDTLFIAGQEVEAGARAPAAAHAHFAGADSHHAEDEAAAARGVSGKSASQRRARCYALADFSSG